MAELPHHVEQLIDRCLDSAQQLDVLLCILLEPERRWTAESLARELRMPELQAQRRLEELAGRSLLDVMLGSAVSYRYAPATPELAQGAAALQRICITRKQEVLARLGERSRDPVDLFADAFRLGRKRDKGDD